MAAKFTHLTIRPDNRLARQQARTACAAALLRWLHVLITRRLCWDPAIAARLQTYRKQPDRGRGSLTPGRFGRQLRPGQGGRPRPQTSSRRCSKRKAAQPGATGSQ
jgi:hypothetical protein